MSLTITDEDKKFLLSLARSTIENVVKRKRIEKPYSYPQKFNENHGIFCTINKNNELRGCIGLPYPVKSVIDALIDAAQSVCEDPRFPPLSEKELKKIKIEISILTEPEMIMVNRPEEYLEKITKEDGLIIRYGPYEGLFLPQVWEQIPGKKDFLDNLCIKAGLTTDMWLDPRAKIYKFSALIISE
ncbi:MAG: AmmeMemoRadiSam system protein A [Candidatus Aenigmatarchaeota archaeon]